MASHESRQKDYLFDRKRNVSSDIGVVDKKNWAQFYVIFSLLFSFQFIYIVFLYIFYYYLF